MGRAGRPQFDDKAVSVILVHDVKKPFYKKFLYEPFPVESSLLEVCFTAYANVLLTVTRTGFVSCVEFRVEKCSVPLLNSKFMPLHLV